VKIHINTRARLRQELSSDGTLTPKQTQEARAETVGDQEASEYESNGDGEGVAVESSLLSGF
jgi:hypothetical protein